MIKKQGSKWTLWTKHGKKRKLGTHKTKTGAQRQERAIQTRKHKTEFSVIRSVILWPLPAFGALAGLIWGIISYFEYWAIQPEFLFKEIAFMPVYLINMLLNFPDVAWSQVDPFYMHGIWFILTVKVGMFLGFTLGMITYLWAKD